MSAISSSVPAFTPPSVNQISRSAQVNNGLNSAATLISGKAFQREVDSNSTGIRIDNETLSTFPASEGGPNTISGLINRAVTTTSTVSPITAQNTSPNPNVQTLMSPTPDGSLAGFASIYA